MKIHTRPLRHRQHSIKTNTHMDKMTNIRYSGGYKSAKKMADTRHLGLPKINNDRISAVTIHGKMPFLSDSV